MEIGQTAPQHECADGAQNSRQAPAELQRAAVSSGALAEFVDGRSYGKVNAHLSTNVG